MRIDYRLWTVRATHGNKNLDMDIFVNSLDLFHHIIFYRLTGTGYLDYTGKKRIDLVSTGNTIKSNARVISIFVCQGYSRDLFNTQGFDFLLVLYKIINCKIQFIR